MFKRVVTTSTFLIGVLGLLTFSQQSFAQTTKADNFFLEISKADIQETDIPFGNAKRAARSAQKTNVEAAAKVAQERFKQPVYLEVCSLSCKLPGLSDEKAFAENNSDAKIVRVPGISDKVEKNDSGYQSAAQKFAEKFNKFVHKSVLDSQVLKVFELGPKEAISFLATNEDVRNTVFDGVADGQAKYIELFKKLKPLSDAFIAESFTQTIGLAIAKNPKAAVDALDFVRDRKRAQSDQIENLRTPCSATSVDFVEAEKGSTEEKRREKTVLKELRAKVKALKTLKSAAGSTARECLEIANEALERTLKRRP